MSQLKYENGVVFVVGHPGISRIIRYLSGGVIDVYGPKGANYTKGSIVPVVIGLHLTKKPHRDSVLKNSNFP